MLRHKCLFPCCLFGVLLSPRIQRAPQLSLPLGFPLGKKRDERFTNSHCCVHLCLEPTASTTYIPIRYEAPPDWLMCSICWESPWDSLQLRTHGVPTVCEANDLLPHVAPRHHYSSAHLLLIFVPLLVISYHNYVPFSS